MPTLSSSIVKREIASVHDVEQALARQSIYGGDLITNLLELAPVDEERLASAVAESVGLEPLPAGRIPRADDWVRQMVPGELARRHAVYPLSASDSELVVAVSESLPRQVASELEISLGLRVIQRSATLVRVQQAISRDYGLDLDRRVAGVLARLDTPPSTIANTPEESPIALSAVSRVAEELGAAPRPGAGLRSSMPPQGWPSRQDVDLAALARTENRAPRQGRRLGPCTATMAEVDLRAAETGDGVMAAFFDFASQYFEYSALFTVHGDLVEGRDARGAGAARTKVMGIGIPLDLPSSLATVIAKDPYRLARLSSSGLDGALVRDLQRRPGVAVLLLPVRVRDRTVLILYGDHGDSDVQLDSVGEVISLAPLVASALARVILRRKGTVQPEPFPGSHLLVAERRSEPKHLPKLKDRAAVLKTALIDSPHAAARIPSLAPALSSTPGDGPRVPARLPASLVQPVISVGPQRSTTPPLGAAVALRLPAAPTLDADAPGSYQPPTPRSGDPYPPSPATPIPSGLAPGSPEFAGSPKLERRATPVRMPPPPPHAAELTPLPAQVVWTPPPAIVSSPELAPHGDPAEPQIVVAESTLEQSVEELLADNEQLSYAPHSRSFAHGARPLPPPGHSKELELPTVIVDLAHDTEELVERTAGGDSVAADRLVEIGAAAIPALVGAFPGPIVSELRRGPSDGPPRASDCGPILRTLARIGPKAAGVLGVRTNDPNPEVRAWGTRLLGEMPCSDAARAVARRFLDEDADVRRAALAAGRMLQTHSGAGSTLANTLSEMLLETGGAETVNQMAIQALADLREARAIPALAALLASGSLEIQRSVHWALIVLARADCGANRAAWDRWWHLNASRHRIEWLIDALISEVPEIRRAAGDELKSVSKEYFGYYDDLPAGERERAQSRYREWWESHGKARFGVPQT